MSQRLGHDPETAPPCGHARRQRVVLLTFLVPLVRDRSQRRRSADEVVWSHIPSGGDHHANTCGPMQGKYAEKPALGATESLPKGARWLAFFDRAGIFA